MLLKTAAIPLRCVDYSDSSQVLSLFTREAGALACIAKGAYRLKSAFEGPFDLATLVEVVVHRRRPPALSIVAESTALDGFRGLRQSWPRWLAAAHLLDFLRAVETPEDPNRALFDAARQACALIDRAEAELGDTLAAFELAAFRALGLGAEIDACGECGRPWRARAQPVFFCVEIAGVLCGDCRRRGGAGRQGRVAPGPVVERLNCLGGILGDASQPLTALAERLRPATPARWRRDLRALLGELRVFLLERSFPVIQYTANFF